MAVIRAISSWQDAIFFQKKEENFNNIDMIQFLTCLKRKNSRKNIAIFLDNSSVHHSN